MNQYLNRLELNQFGIKEKLRTFYLRGMVLFLNFKYDDKTECYFEKRKALKNELKRQYEILKKEKVPNDLKEIPLKSYDPTVTNLFIY